MLLKLQTNFLISGVLYLLKTAVDARLYVAAAERLTFSELARNLDALLQQQAESRFINSASVVCYQTE